MSNSAGSKTQYIRIDGSTNPQERQNQIQRFQDPRNPDIRIAVLGITAAGVAVTLTASSTVWFAELFWTPALMIQAEDRVHRCVLFSIIACASGFTEGLRFSQHLIFTYLILIPTIAGSAKRLRSKFCT